MTITKTNRPVYDAAISLERADAKDAKVRITLFMAMDVAGANETTLKSGGELYDDLLEGVIVGWQGAAFLKSFNSDKVATRQIKGKLLNVMTGKEEAVTKTRKEWQQNLSSKVSKARAAFLAWQAGPKEKAVAGKKELATRIVETMTALHKAVAKDQAGESPSLSCDYNELLAAFVRAMDIVQPPKATEPRAKRTKK